MIRTERGQSMVEYTIVTSALVLALFYATTAECDGYDSCVSKLLTVMHDNYDGYSASITAVQQYPDVNLASPVTSDIETINEPSSPPDSDGGTGSGGGSLPTAPAISETQILTDANTNQLLGTIQSDGSVINEAGDVVGVYDQESGSLITGAGGNVTAIASSEIYDQEGNRLYPRALVDCLDSSRVYGWAYLDTINGDAYNTLNLNEIDTNDYCSVFSYGITSEGQPYPGRIVDGQYYQNTLSIRPGIQPQMADGELILLSGSNSCLVARTGWDEGVQSPSSSEAEAIIRREQNFIGELNRAEYFVQTGLTNCPAARMF